MAFLSLVLFFCGLRALHVHGVNMCNNYITINDIRRSTAYRKTTDLCDRGFIKDGSWYRFESAGGNEMPTTKPDIRSCGTYAPIWMKGSHPTASNVSVVRKACANVPFKRPVGCGISFDIEVVKCDTFYIYKLKEPGQCNLAYCAGSSTPTACSTTGDTVPVCPGVIPTVGQINAGVKEEASETVRLKCVWDYTGNTTNVEFHVRWFGNENDPQHKIERFFNGTAEREFVFHFSINTTTQVIDSTGYEFNKKVYCQVRARFTSGSWSKWKLSGKIYTGIIVYPRKFGLEDCGNKKRDVDISLIPHLPIRVRPLKIEIEKPTTSLIDAICVRGLQDNCQISLTSKHSINAPLKIKLRTTCGYKEAQGKNVKNVIFKLARISFSDETNSFWQGFTFPKINIFERKTKRKQCHSVTDPHFLTFDGRNYNFYGRGTFILYENSHFGTEVHTRQKACNGGHASCNCGVAIKEHAFYKIFDMCYEDGSNAWWKGGILIRKRQLPDFKKNGFFTVKKTEGSTIIYEVNLPSGVVVTIARRNWGLSTYVTVPVYDDRRDISNGLCGNNDNVYEKFTDENKFGESWRIRGKSVFDYKGDKMVEAQINDGCKETMCICKTGRESVCEGEAIKKCFPSVYDRTREDDRIGICSPTRKRRDLDSDDDTIDDQDDIPPFNPPDSNQTIVATWPTANLRLTETNVTNFCNKKLRFSQAGETCGNITGVDIDALVGQCIADIQITEDFSWGTDNFAALEKTCMTNVYKNISLYKNNTDGELELPIAIMASVCPNDCSDRGTCANRTCTCVEDYTAPDCSISLKQRPDLVGIRKSGLCDVRKRPCRNVGIYGFPFLDSENLTCHIQEYKVIESGWTPQNSISLHPGYLADLTEVKCTLPAPPINIGDYDNEGVSAAGLKIAISNNRINASEVSMLFIAFDSVCQECNTTTGCNLKTDACLISGHCFTQNQSNPRDWCDQCLPDISLKSWTRRRYNQPPTFRTSTLLYAFFDEVLRVRLRANDPENRPIRFTLEQSSTANASLTNTGIFTWISNSNDSTWFMFKVYDECGLSDVLNITVVIKQCPCQNDGRCKPDSDDLNGYGNFTCLCNYGYNGTLCEHDIDECISSPCVNGACINKKPGFSCSCNDGYAGLLCNVDINECLSSPCFLGVSCYDRVNGYQCGPCPNGYTGTGEICNRTDGTIDECIKSPNVCHQTANCTYYNESYSCRCAAGYTGDGKINCTDVDECSVYPDVCHTNATCTNFAGSYSCHCKVRFSGDGNINCTDIDECSISPAVCHTDAICTNYLGSYSCQCKVGFSGDGNVNCTDVNECSKSPGVCHRNAVCTNSKGSYFCECSKGYNGHGISNCTDINECSQPSLVCHQNAICTNTDGSYSCQCGKGYLGDGKINCKENIPPRFTIPSKVYAILNKDFQIQIKAVDPENQNLNYSLLANGTITNAQLSQDGLLTMLVQETGNVSVKVEDGFGGQRVLILQIIAIPCTCQHGGECKRANSSSYPEDASDYICKCEIPYVGDYCESRSDPCKELPCFPGLECSPTNSSFTCEECPNLFQGNGVKCELKSAAETSSHKTELTLKSEEWNDELKNKDSSTYKKLVFQVTIEIKEVYKDRQEFGYVMITGFRQGSVIVEFEMIFTKNAKDPLNLLQEAVKDGKLGNMTVEMKEHDKEPEKDEKILGLDKTIFIVVVTAAGLLIIMVSFVIYRRVKISHRIVNLKPRGNDHEMQPKGLLFQQSMVEPGHIPETQGQGISPVTFENKVVLEENLD